MKVLAPYGVSFGGASGIPLLLPPPPPGRGLFFLSSTVSCVITRSLFAVVYVAHNVVIHAVEETWSAHAVHTIAVSWLVVVPFLLFVYSFAVHEEFVSCSLNYY
jgi:hypothetical protein